MIKLNLECSWDELLEMVLEAAPQLSPDDIDFTQGEDEELVRKLAQKLNRSYEHTIGWLESVSSTEVKAS